MQDLPYVPMDERLYRYVVDTTAAEAPVLAELREATRQHFAGEAHLQIGPDQGAVLGWLSGLLGLQRYLEIGTFTGYSCLTVLLNAPAGAQAICLDRNQSATTLARRYWQRAGVSDRVQLELGEARDGLARWAPALGESLDMAFIDADKQGYIAYYEAVLPLLRPGGVVVADNVLWQGSVADPADTTADTEALRAFNRHVTADTRTGSCLLTVGDGLLVAYKR